MKLVLLNLSVSINEAATSAHFDSNGARAGHGCTCARGSSSGSEVFVVLAYLLLEAAVPPFRPPITKVVQGK